MTNNQFPKLLLAAAISLAPTPSAWAEPASTEFTELQVYPPQVTLDHAADTQQVVAIAYRADGMTLDVTDLANWRVEPEHGAAEAVTLDSGVLSASGNGVARVTAEFAGLSATIDAHSAGDTPAPGVSFRHDVMPVFMRAGCNAGGCHGASRGKDGFRLSLFGFDPAGDHHRLTREMAARRLNPALPDESLMLEKAIAAVPHSGGKLFDKESIYYQMLRDWVAAGTPNDVAEAPAVTSLSLYPPAAAVGAGGQGQRFVAVAQYSNGATRDVTHLAVFQSNNSVSAEIDDAGRVTSGKRGEAFVMARFDTHTVGSQVLVLPSGQPFEPVEEQHANFIDELVGQKLRTLRINSSPIASDEEFLRRVSIDIAGRLPSPEEREAFLADSDPGKRAAKIDELLAGPEFAQVWAAKWCDLLMVREQPNRVEYKPMFLYSQWVTEQINSDRPFDDVVRDLLSASGTTFDTPQVNFYQSEPDQKKIAENAAQVFLGIRIQCAQCHNHPFDRWTMDDYYSFTAFFSQIARKAGEDYREVMIYNRGGGDSKHPVTGAAMAPKFLGGQVPDTKGQDRRRAVADWVASPDNPYFATSVANRVWAHFLGRGVVHPVDDIRVSNPASNPALFEALGKRFVESGFSLRSLAREICNSNAYQRSCQPNDSNATDVSNFARATPRRIPAESLWDCLSQATATEQDKLPGLPPGARAVEIADGSKGNYFLTTFGKSQRESVCACGAVTEPTLSQALHMLNGDATQGKISRGKLVDGWIAEELTNEQIIDQIYLRCLCRQPTDDERSKLVALTPDKEGRGRALQDVFWAVLNSREFLFNH
ncbi:hypothetical protein Pla123a_13060 [Posidoniimonas polymericola]|uniref:Bacterial Ig-like domain (Group 2) n=1 Tax=Posidoniimonas polymericola TaxID=2528002 RepID=A0A5C5YV48_9BACT|nr:DUF1549 and DUF1553 domain-containing protein [Posidoniimonas polymericola]TWT78513.1 hypothetical protein Pla123a_13060 [Posidoniimonas polymericola]